jgi:hypothetical protein
VGDNVFLSTTGTSPEIDVFRVAARERVRSIGFPGPLDPNQRLPPMLTAYEEQITWTPVSSSTGPNAGGGIPESSRDGVLQGMLDGLPIWDDKAEGFPALVMTPEDTAVPLCGQVQRWSFWNQTCPKVFGTYGAFLNAPLTFLWFPDPGGSVYVTHTGPSIMVDPTTLLSTNGSPAPRCSVREARTLVATCPPGSICGSGGVCVFGRQNSGGIVVTPPPPPVTVLTSPL